MEIRPALGYESHPLIGRARRAIIPESEYRIVSSMHRNLAGDVLVHHLTEDEMLIDRGLVAQHGRSARTLVKEGPLRVTMIALAPNGLLPAHSTVGPISIQLLEGDITFTAGGQEYALAMRDLLVIAAEVEHSARSTNGGAFLLTVVHPASAGSIASPQSA